MARREFIPRNWREHPHAGAPNLTILRSEDPITGTEYEYTLDVLSSALVRTTFTSTRHPLEPHPFLATAPPRTIATALPTTSTPTRKTITLPGLRADDPTRTLTLDWSSTPTVCTSSPPYADLPLRSWAADGAGVSHYSAYDASGASLYFGLGEKAAPLDLRARTFSVSASDAFGYDAHRSDPLYKHVPWLVRASSAGCAGILWASRARGSVSVGGEMDGLWGRYVAYRQQVGGAEGFLVFGADMAALMRAYAALVGRPRLVPRWALGYVAGGMRYSMSDDPPADGVILGFVDRCARERIPCSAFQLSSGYTVAERPPRTRNVFTWNRRRFRDPGAWVAGMRRRGVRVVANLKPYVLRCHPAYDALEAAGALFVDPRTGRAAVTRLWSAGGGESEDGSHLDFTAREAWEWWRGGVAGIRALGIEGIWNDNNEYTIPDDDWVCAADLPLLQDGLRTAVRSTPGEATDGDRSVGVWTRAVHSELMARCSFEAAQSVAAGERTYVLTRSATPGAMRFACSTWSGDNTSSWDDFAGSVAMTQAAGLSLFPVRFLPPLLSNVR
jgi:alpha-glucosidase (family GH31 glycosyl hydrolase)